MRGWVYVISNKAMHGLVKVGFSLKDPRLRARELNHTGSPHPYVVEYDVFTDNPKEVEQKTHALLFMRREGKEWFRCSLADAVNAIQQVSRAAITEQWRDGRKRIVARPSVMDSNAMRAKLTKHISNEAELRRCTAKVAGILRGLVAPADCREITVSAISKMIANAPRYNVLLIIRNVSPESITEQMAANIYDALAES